MFLVCPCCGKLSDEDRFGRAHEPSVRVRTAGGYKSIAWATRDLTSSERATLRESAVRALVRLDDG